jgi:hypothetical protein
VPRKISKKHGVRRHVVATSIPATHPIADNSGMRDARPNFSETLHDWRADPSNARASGLFQPKGLGTPIRAGRRSRGLRRILMLVFAAVAVGAGVLAVNAFVHLMR